MSVLLRNSNILHCALASCGAVYCNRYYLWVYLFVDVWVCVGRLFNKMQQPLSLEMGLGWCRGNLAPSTTRRLAVF